MRPCPSPTAVAASAVRDIGSSVFKRHLWHRRCQRRLLPVLFVPVRLVGNAPIHQSLSTLEVLTAFKLRFVGRGGEAPGLPRTKMHMLPVAAAPWEHDALRFTRENIGRAGQLSNCKALPTGNARASAVAATASGILRLRLPTSKLPKAHGFPRHNHPADAPTTSLGQEVAQKKLLVPVSSGGGGQYILKSGKEKG
jgi:hypothetical protein